MKWAPSDATVHLLDFLAPYDGRDDGFVGAAYWARLIRETTGLYLRVGDGKVVLPTKLVSRLRRALAEGDRQKIARWLPLVRYHGEIAPPQINEERREKIWRKLFNLPVSLVAVIGQYPQRLFAFHMSGQQRLEVLKSLSSLTARHLKAIIYFVDTLIPKGSFEKCSSLIMALSKNDEKRFFAIAKTLRMFVNNLTTPESDRAVVIALNKLSERQLTLLAVGNMIKAMQGTNAFDCYKVFSALVDLRAHPVPKVQDLLGQYIKFCHSFLYPLPNESNSRRLIATFAVLGEEKSREVFKHVAFECSDTDWSHDNIIMLVNRMGMMSVKQLKRFVEKWKCVQDAFLKPSMISEHRALITALLCSLTPEELDRFSAVWSQHKNAFVAEHMDGEDHAYVLKALMRMNPDDIQTMGQVVSSLLTHDMNGYSRGQIIEALDRLSAEEKRDFVQAWDGHKELFVKDDVNGFQRAKMIVALSSLKGGDLNAFLVFWSKKSPIFVRGNIKGKDLAGCVNILSGLSPEKRCNAANYAQAVFKSEDNIENYHSKIEMFIQWLEGNTQRVNEIKKWLERETLRAPSFGGVCAHPFFSNR